MLYHHQSSQQTSTSFPWQLPALSEEAPVAPRALQLHRDVACDAQVELISWKSIKDIAGDGGIIKTIETEGKGWEKPTDKDEALGTHAPAAVDGVSRGLEFSNLHKHCELLLWDERQIEPLPERPDAVCRAWQVISKSHGVL